MITEDGIDEIHFLKRLELIKKSALATRDLTPEEMLTKGFELILFAKNAKFRVLNED